MRIFLKNPQQQNWAPEQRKQAGQNKMSDNVTLTSLCGFSRKFLFSVDLNLKKVILQKFLALFF